MSTLLSLPWGRKEGDVSVVILLAAHCARAQRQTFQQRGKELGSGENHPPHPLPAPAMAAPSTSEAWVDQEMVPKSLSHPRLFHRSSTEWCEDRNRSILWYFGVSSHLVHSGAAPTSKKG